MNNCIFVILSTLKWSYNKLEDKPGYLCLVTYAEITSSPLIISCSVIVFMSEWVLSETEDRAEVKLLPIVWTSTLAESTRSRNDERKQVGEDEWCQQFWLRGAFSLHPFGCANWFCPVANFSLCWKTYITFFRLPREVSTQMAFCTNINICVWKWLIASNVEDVAY